MSNPLINRWGMNLFWYKIWYIDKSQFLFFNQDSLIERLVFLYIHYGILYSKNIFFNKYWYGDSIDTQQIHQDNLKYYRVIEYKNKLLNKSYFYNIRIKIKNIHVTKLWLLRFQGWLVLNFYCFQLIQKKNNMENFFKRNQNLLFVKNSGNLKKYTRVKLIMYFILNNFLLKKNYYSF